MTGLEDLRGTALPESLKHDELAEQKTFPSTGEKLLGLIRREPAALQDGTEEFGRRPRGGQHDIESAQLLGSEELPSAQQFENRGHRARSHGVSPGKVR
jgi:hypothetical protein